MAFTYIAGWLFTIVLCYVMVRRPLVVLEPTDTHLSLGRPRYHPGESNCATRCADLL